MNLRVGGISCGYRSSGYTDFLVHVAIETISRLFHRI